MHQLQISIKESSAQAPNYNFKGTEFKAALLTQAVIVKKGTENGKTTVDLVLEIKDSKGKTESLCVAMITGAIIKGLAAAIRGAEK